MFQPFLHILTGLYVVALVILTVFTSSFGVLLVIYLLKRSHAPTLPPVEDATLPTVTVQIPVYNEAHVIARLIDACFQLDYPRHKLHIQVLDDSTDETTAIIAERMAHWQSEGFAQATHIRRPHRDGYKAGALAYGLRQIETVCVAIFDADFIPSPDFLRRTLPYFVHNGRLALVQTRWAHLNATSNLLTRAQALSIDGHFAIEQVARNRGRLPMSMNGTGGVWRLHAIDDAGGWSADTLTEDLDLSYRALQRGWEFLYLAEVEVPGEVPPQVQAYKRQQARWATGSTECLLRHAHALIVSPHFSPFKTFMGLMHLSQYAIQPVILLLFLLTPVLLATDRFNQLPDLRILAVVGVIPPLVIALAQVELYADWHRRLLYFPVQFMVAAALALNNTQAVLKAVFQRRDSPAVFERTPKFSDSQWRRSRYALRVDKVTFGELVLGVYALLGVVLALIYFPPMMPYMLSYAVSFIGFAMWNIWQTR